MPNCHVPTTRLPTINPCRVRHPDDCGVPSRHGLAPPSLRQSAWAPLVFCPPQDKVSRATKPRKVEASDRKTSRP